MTSQTSSSTILPSLYSHQTPTSPNLVSRKSAFSNVHPTKVSIALIGNAHHYYWASDHYYVAVKLAVIHLPFCIVYTHNAVNGLDGLPQNGVESHYQKSDFLFEDND